MRARTRRHAAARGRKRSLPETRTSSTATDPIPESQRGSEAGLATTTARSIAGARLLPGRLGRAQQVRAARAPALRVSKSRVGAADLSPGDQRAAPTTR
eukprot:16441919-Heterocapsa_arctica.AAC.1